MSYQQLGAIVGQVPLVPGRDNSSPFCAAEADATSLSATGIKRHAVRALSQGIDRTINSYLSLLKARAQ